MCLQTAEAYINHQGSSCGICEQNTISPETTPQTEEKTAATVTGEDGSLKTTDKSYFIRNWEFGNSDFSLLR